MSEFKFASMLNFELATLLACERMSLIEGYHARVRGAGDREGERVRTDIGYDEDRCWFDLESGEMLCDGDAMRLIQDLRTTVADLADGWDEFQGCTDLNESSQAAGKMQTLVDLAREDAAPVPTPGES